MTSVSRILSLSALLGGIAVPAAAQDLCGGVGNNGVWIGGSEAASDISVAEDFREQMALVLGANDYVSLFNLTESTVVRIEAQGRGSGDPLFEVVASDGTLIASDDDSGGNGAARVELSLDAGTYCVSTSSYDSSPMTAFVRIGQDLHEALTPGVESTSANTSGDESGYDCSGAMSLGAVGDMVTNEMSVNEAPFLRFTLDEARAISLTAENEDADPVLTLFDANEEFIDENDDSDGLNSRIDVSEPLPAGEYCIGVDALNDPDLPILVTISEYDPVAALMAMVNRAEAAPPLDGSVEITDLGVVQTRLRLDAQITDEAKWFSVEVPDAGLLLVEAISADGTGDPFIAVFDDFGRSITSNDDYGDSYDAQATARVNRGVYYIGLKEVASDTQSFVRMGLERWVPAPK